MTGTDELLRLLLPVIGATKVGALWPVCNHLVGCGFYDPGGALFGADAPTINATLLEA